MLHRVAIPARRATARLLLAALLLAAAACGGEPPRGAPRTSGLSGRYRLVHENGASDLVVEEKEDGVVTVTGNGQTSTGRVVGPNRVEGKEEDENGSGTFVLELQGDRLVARFSLRGPSGETVELPELVFERVKEGGGASGSAAPAAAAGPRDAALQGHWRHTDARASGGFSVVTDRHLVLEADGRYAAWSRTEGSVGSGEGERTSGVWETKDGALRLRQDGADAWSESRYQLSGDTLLRTYPSGDKEVYERL